MLYFSLVLESVGRTESSFVNKLWHQLEPRGELGTETEVWEGRHTRGGGLVPEHKPRHTSRRISAREKMLSELRRGGGACVVPLGRDQRRPEGGGGCTVPGGGQGRGGNPQRPSAPVNLFICIFPSDFSSRRSVSAEHSPHPLFLFPGPRSSLAGLAPKASMGVFSTHGGTAGPFLPSKDSCYVGQK